MTTTVAIIGAVGWLGLTFAAAALGARFLPDEWYRRLNKPTWNPPNFIFAPVWSILYLLMAAAAWLVWRRHGLSRPAKNRRQLHPVSSAAAQEFRKTGWCRRPLRS